MIVQRPTGIRDEEAVVPAVQIPATSHAPPKGDSYHMRSLADVRDRVAGVICRRHKLSNVGVWFKMGVRWRDGSVRVCSDSGAVGLDPVMGNETWD